MTPSRHGCFKTTLRATSPRTQAAALFASGLLIAVFHFITLDPSMAWGGDNALYIAHARNLIEGIAYNATGFIQNPGDMVSPQSYPPGLPVLLAPVYALFGLNILAFKLEMLALFMLALAIVTGYFRRRLAAVSAGPVLVPVAFCVLLGLNPVFSVYAGRIMSDIPFVLFVYLALAVLERAYAFHPGHKTTTVWALVAGVTIYLAISMRVLGLVLLPTVALYELLRYRQITRVALIALSLALALWAIQNVLLWLDAATLAGSHAGYSRMMGNDLVSRLAKLPVAMLENAIHYAKTLSAVWYSGTLNLPLKAFTILMLLTAIYGFVRRITVSAGLPELFALLYGLALLPWSIVFSRYLIPLIPLYFFYVLVGLAELARALPAGRGLRRAPAACVIAIGASLYTLSHAGSATIFGSIDPRSANSPAAMAAYRYIRTQTPDDAVIIFRQPRVPALFTGRRASTYVHNDWQAPRSDTQMMRYFEHTHANYALDGPPDREHRIDALARRHPYYFERVFNNDAFRLYRFARPDR